MLLYFIGQTSGLFGIYIKYISLKNNYEENFEKEYVFINLKYIFVFIFYSTISMLKVSLSIY